jgi:hypothetical protein
LHKEQAKLFWEIIAEAQDIASLQPTPMGATAEKNWKEIPVHFPFVELDEFVVMPNHIHGILFLIRRICAIGPQTNSDHNQKIWHQSFGDIKRL